jgi:hypothetical protein
MLARASGTHSRARSVVVFIATGLPAAPWRTAASRRWARAVAAATAVVVVVELAVKLSPPWDGRGEGATETPHRQLGNHQSQLIKRSKN